MRFKQQDSHLSIILDHAPSANALTLENLQLLSQKLRSQKWSLVSCRAEGRVFSSGGPLKEFAMYKTKQQGLKYHRQMTQLLTNFHKCSAFKVAFVSGDCFGGGIEFLSCFDEIYCEPHVLFGFWQSRLGLSYGWGGYKRLQNKICAGYLKTALLEDQVATAYEMQRQGLIKKILSREAMESQLQAWVEDRKSNV